MGRYNVPGYASVPEHGSWGVGLTASPGQSVIAPSPANQGGGYPSVDQVERSPLTAKQHQNVQHQTTNNRPTTSMAEDPKRYNVPAYASVPPHGS
jgi:hypothetical protein